MTKANSESDKGHDSREWGGMIIDCQLRSLSSRIPIRPDRQREPSMNDRGNRGVTYHHADPSQAPGTGISV